MNICVYLTVFLQCPCHMAFRACRGREVELIKILLNLTNELGGVSV